MNQFNQMPSKIAKNDVAPAGKYESMDFDQLVADPFAGNILEDEAINYIIEVDPSFRTDPDLLLSPEKSRKVSQIINDRYGEEGKLEVTKRTKARLN